MALMNVIGTGGYTVVNITGYNKSNKQLGLELVTYATSLKSVIRGSFDIFISAATDLNYSVITRSLTEPPEAPVEKDKYLVAPEATGLWEGLDGQVVAFNGLTWDQMTTGQPTLVLDEGIVLEEESPQVWVVKETLLTEADWDAWFGVDAISGEDNNLVKRSYEFVKALSYFSAATDV